MKAVDKLKKLLKQLEKQRATGLPPDGFADSDTGFYRGEEMMLADRHVGEAKRRGK